MQVLIDLKLSGIVAAASAALLVGCGPDEKPSNAVPPSAGGGTSTPVPAPSPAPTPTPTPTPTPNALGSGFDVVSEPNGDFTATFIDFDGVTYRARQIPQSSSWVVESNAPIEGIFGFGQSNTGPAGEIEADDILTATLYPRTVLGSPIGVATGSAAMPGVSSAPFVDLTTASQRKPIPNVLDNWAVEQIARDEGVSPKGLFGFTVYDNGKAIEHFLPGTNNYAALLAHVRLSKSSAALYGREFVVRAVIWHQGETASRDYAGKLAQLVNALQRDIQSVTGQNFLPEFMIRQVSAARSGPVDIDVPLKHLSFAKEHQARGVTLLGPTYYGPISDGIHFSTRARMMFADVAAVAIAKLRKGEFFTPLWPVKAARNGRVIDVEFALPAGPLKFDRDLVRQIEHEGFSFTSYESDADIESVTILNDHTIRITLDKEPGSQSRKLSYAMTDEGLDPVFSASRGTLFSEDASESVYARLDEDVPRKIRHYAVRFRIEVP